MTRTMVMGFLVFCAFLVLSVQAAAQGTCTRTDLQSAVDSYLAAQRSGSPAALPLASPAKYVENTVDSAFDKGILKSALKIDFSRSLLDVAICETFTEVIVTDKSHPYVLGVRIKVANRKISELETLVTDADDWLFNADNYMKYSPAENWGVIPAAARDSRQTLIAAANAYFDVFDDNNVKVPWGTPCNRLEGGIRTGRGMPDDSCNVGVPTGMKLTNRRFVADPEIGAVVGFIRWPTTVPDSHLFRVESGKLRFVHSLTGTTVETAGLHSALRPQGDSKRNCFRSLGVVANVGPHFRKIKEAIVKGYKAVLLGSALVISLGYQAVNGQAGKQAAAPNATIERGRYVVEIGGCNDCHTAGYAEAGGKAAEADRLKGDMLGYRGPWGTTYPTNLRLSIGKMTEEAWLKYAKTLNTRPPMPWFNVRAMTDADQRALYQYVKSLGAGGTAAPAFLSPDKTPKPPFIQWPGVK